jgi:hypothetical protein
VYSLLFTIVCPISHHGEKTSLILVRLSNISIRYWPPYSPTYSRLLDSSSHIALGMLIWTAGLSSSDKSQAIDRDWLIARRRLLFMSASSIPLFVYYQTSWFVHLSPTRPCCRWSVTANDLTREWHQTDVVVRWTCSTDYHSVVTHFYCLNAWYKLLLPAVTWRTSVPLSMYSCIFEVSLTTSTFFTLFTERAFGLLATDQLHDTVVEVRLILYTV